MNALFLTSLALIFILIAVGALTLRTLLLGRSYEDWVATERSKRHVRKPG